MIELNDDSAIQNSMMSSLSDLELLREARGEPGDWNRELVAGADRELVADREEAWRPIALKNDSFRPAKKFRLSAKHVFLTYPKCTLSRERLANALKAKKPYTYIMVALEKHEDGTPHLHSLVSYAKKLDVISPTFYDVEGFHGNYQPAKSTDDVLKYITKADLTPYTEGVYESNDAKAVQIRVAEKNKLIVETDLYKLVDNGTISMYSYKQLKQCKDLYLIDKVQVAEKVNKQCIWIVGKSGIGKSSYIRDHFPGKFFNKAQNKWWDGYKGQQYVLIDDFDMTGRCLSHYLKIWGDNYSFNAEIKGGTLVPDIHTFIITSQYTPEQIWDSARVAQQADRDPEVVEAIMRRFKLMTIDKEYKLVNYVEFGEYDTNPLHQWNKH